MTDRRLEREMNIHTGTELGKGAQGALYERLRAYGESDYYGFHMPGHKRQAGGLDDPYRLDITEIEGFDDLHHPEPDGILTRAQERAAGLYGASETHFLVNGSTAGILSAVSGCTKQNGKLLMARNCHRSAYHAAALRGLRVAYLYPPEVENPGINGGIFPEDVEKSLLEDGEIQAVFITSPTYDGICSDVRAIADICHSFGRPLIVDQAHGAHFPFSGYFPEDAVSAGADVVIHSVHKTLPSLTQTALLHIQGRLADREKIRYYLSVYQSSSPSYLLMASIDNCMELLEREGEALFETHAARLQTFRESCRDLRRLSLLGEALPKDKAIYDFDRSKLLISAWKAAVSGHELARLLREGAHLQMEMAAPYYLMGIASAADTEEGFARLSRALHELDAELAERPETAGGLKAVTGTARAGADVKAGAERAQARVPMGEALERASEHVGLDNCVGKTSAAFLYVYPPGIPLLTPGEEVLPGIRDRILAYQEAGLEVHGLTDGGRIAVLR